MLALGRDLKLTAANEIIDLMFASDPQWLTLLVFATLKVTFWSRSQGQSRLFSIVRQRMKLERLDLRIEQADSAILRNLIAAKNARSNRIRERACFSSASWQNATGVPFVR